MKLSSFLLFALGLFTQCEFQHVNEVKTIPNSKGNLEPMQNVDSSRVRIGGAKDTMVGAYSDRVFIQR